MKRNEGRFTGPDDHWVLQYLVRSPQARKWAVNRGLRALRLAWNQGGHGVRRDSAQLRTVASHVMEHRYVRRSFMDLGVRTLRCAVPDEALREILQRSLVKMDLGDVAILCVDMAFERVFSANANVQPPSRGNRHGVSVGAAIPDPTEVKEVKSG